MSAVGNERNWLLQGLEHDVRKQFDAKLQCVQLDRGQVLHHEGDQIERVYFPEGALIGLISTMPAGETVQTAMVGWDGALGVFEACGSRHCSARAEVRVAGPAWCMPADDYRRMFDASHELRARVHKHIEFLLTEARQFVACNALHDVQGRLSRSILEALERSRDGRSLHLTQEILAQMLGVQRTTIAAAIAELKSTGCIEVSRSRIEILKKAAIEALACPCRESIETSRTVIYQSQQKVCDA